MSENAEDVAPAGPLDHLSTIKTFSVPVLMLSMKFLKVDTSIYLQELRICFACVVLLNFSVMALLYFKIQSAVECGPIEVTEKTLEGTDKKTKMSSREYDTKKLREKLGQACLHLCITSGIHYKWGNAMPLLLQSINMPLGILDDNLFKIHIFGCAAEGKMARPFKPPVNPLAKMLGADEPAEIEPAKDDKKRSKRTKKD